MNDTPPLPRAVVVRSALVAALGGLLFGFDTVVISGTNSALKRVFDLDEFWLGFTVATALVGTVVGSLAIGRPADALGRRRVLAALAVAYFASAVVSGVARTWYELIAARFLGGLAIGGASVVVPLYIAEIAPPAWRGRLVALNQFNIVFGILSAFGSNYAISLLVTGDSAWRWMLGVVAVPSAAFFALLFTIPESPRWLVLSGRDGEAGDVLRRIGVPDADAELRSIRGSLADTRGGEPLFQRRYLRPALLASVAVGGVNLLFTMAALTVIDRFGRRFLLLVGSVGCAVCLGVVAWQFALPTPDGRAVLAALLAYIAFFAFSQGAVIWVFISEVFPNATSLQPG